MKNATELLRKLDYLPRWGWYLLSMIIAGPIGLAAVYLIFYALNKAATDERRERHRSHSAQWNVDIDDDGVHVSSRRQENTYREASFTVMDEEEVNREWTRTESSAGRARARSARTASGADFQEAASDFGSSRSVYQEAKPDETVIGEDADVESVIREGRAAMRRIRHANDLIPDEDLSANIDSIEHSCQQILEILEQRPQLLTQLRTFLRYYLPTTLRLLDARAQLESNANTPKAREVRERISQAVTVIDKAFLKQVEALDEYRFIDLESEMDVLKDMLKADGLLDEEKEADPFADVLSKKYDSGEGQSLASH